MASISRDRHATNLDSCLSKAPDEISENRISKSPPALRCRQPRQRRNMNRRGCSAPARKATVNRAQQPKPRSGDTEGRAKTRKAFEFQARHDYMKLLSAVGFKNCERSAMSAHDTFHDALKHALEKDGWTITHDPLKIKYEGLEMFIDLGAEKLLAAEKEGQSIAVEIKSFLGSSAIFDFHTALWTIRELPRGPKAAGSQSCALLGSSS